MGVWRHLHSHCVYHAGVCSVLANPGSYWIPCPFQGSAQIKATVSTSSGFSKGRLYLYSINCSYSFWGRMPSFFSFFEYNAINLCFTLPLFSFKSSSLSGVFWYILGYGGGFFCLVGLAFVVWDFLNVYVFSLIVFTFLSLNILILLFLFSFPHFSASYFFLPILFPALCALLPFHIFFLYFCSKKAT